VPVVSAPATTPAASPTPGMPVTEAVGADGRSGRELLVLVALGLAVLLGAGGVAGLYLTRERE